MCIRDSIYPEQTQGRSGKPATIYPDSSGRRLAVFGTKEQAFLWDPAKPADGFTPLGASTGQAARFIRDQSSLSGGPQNITVGVALKTSDGFSVLRPGAREAMTIARTTTGDALTVWPQREVLLQVQKKPPKVTTHALEKTFFADLWSNVKLPSRLTEIDAVASWHRQQMHVVIGKTAEGDTLLAPLQPGILQKAEHETVLPKGATFRGLRPTEDGLQGSFIVDYTMPGDPVELSAYRHLKIDLFG